jgi:PHD/YefM family antitoxin component YafN of YafNO toxin-antitoxin module
MSVSSSSTIAEKREEAVKLFISSVQQPITIANLGDEAAKQVIKGADILLNYIEYGKTD